MRSCFLALPYEIASWQFLVVLVNAGGDDWCPGAALKGSLCF